MPSLEAASGLPAAAQHARLTHGGGAASGRQQAVAPMATAAPTSFDEEYQQWRSEQLRKLELSYPEWRQDSYRDFLENFPQSSAPAK